MARRPVGRSARAWHLLRRVVRPALPQPAFLPITPCPCGRRGAGAVDRDGLEIRCMFTRTVGSNPPSPPETLFFAVFLAFLTVVPSTVPSKSRDLGRTLANGSCFVLACRLSSGMPEDDSLTPATHAAIVLAGFVVMKRPSGKRTARQRVDNRGMPRGTPPRRFPAPWRVLAFPAGRRRVEDANGYAVVLSFRRHRQRGKLLQPGFHWVGCWPHQDRRKGGLAPRGRKNDFSANLSPSPQLACQRRRMFACEPSIADSAPGPGCCLG